MAGELPSDDYRSGAQTHDILLLALLLRSPTISRLGLLKGNPTFINLVSLNLICVQILLMSDDR